MSTALSQHNKSAVLTNVWLHIQIPKLIVLLEYFVVCITEEKAFVTFPGGLLLLW